MAAMLEFRRGRRKRESEVLDSLDAMIDDIRKRRLTKTASIGSAKASKS
jgi:hypothetical protein